LPQMLDVSARAKTISGQPNYNLACALAMNGRELGCKAELLACQAAGSLPDAAHLRADQDLESVWETDWFKALTGVNTE
jgi:hypothetical protein